MRALSSDLEGNAVGGLALHLKGGGGDMVEVLVQQLYRHISLLDFLTQIAQALFE